LSAILERHARAKEQRMQQDSSFEDAAAHTAQARMMLSLPIVVGDGVEEMAFAADASPDQLLEVALEFARRHGLEEGGGCERGAGPKHTHGDDPSASAASASASASAWREAGHACVARLLVAGAMAAGTASRPRKPPDSTTTTGGGGGGGAEGLAGSRGQVGGRDPGLPQGGRLPGPYEGFVASELALGAIDVGAFAFPTYLAFARSSSAQQVDSGGMASPAAAAAAAAAAKKKAQATPPRGMSKAKAKAYERMLADLDRQEALMAAEQERLRTNEEEELKRRRLEERARKEAILAARARRQLEAKERKGSREAAALNKRRELQARRKAAKEERDRILKLELEEKTRVSSKVRGQLRPDGRLKGREVTASKYMYFGDFEGVGKEATDHLRGKWGEYADPDLYYWVPRGYGEFRNHAAQEAFMEGELTRGTMNGQGTLRFGDEMNNAQYRGSFTNDRPQGFGDWSEPSGDPAAPVEHRLEVYQRGKPICFLDELVTGTRIKLFGPKFGEYLTDGRGAAPDAKPSKLPVMPHKTAANGGMGATILEAVSYRLGIFRVKPDFGGASLVVSLKSTLWDLDRSFAKPFQGVELYTGEFDPNSTFQYDVSSTGPMKAGQTKDKPTSDHRENLFGESSRVKVAARQAAERQKMGTRILAAHEAEEREARLAKEVAEFGAAQKKEAQRSAKEERRLERAALKDQADKEAALKQEQARANTRRAQALESSRKLAPVLGAAEPRRGGIKPNAGSLILDAERWTFIPSAVSLPGPGPPRLNRPRPKSAMGSLPSPKPRNNKK